MIEAMKLELAESAKPVVAWLQIRGLDFLRDVLVAALILLAGSVAIKLLTRFLRRALACKMGDREMLMRFVLSVVVKCAWAFLIVIVLERLGVSVAPLIAGLGITGFVLGFAFQESLASLAAGVMIAFNRPFKIGDCVILCGYEGTVLKLDMMAVVLVTKDNRRITIPNRQAWSGPIANCTVLGAQGAKVA